MSSERRWPNIACTSRLLVSIVLASGFGVLPSASTHAGKERLEKLNPKDFVRGAEITNKWMPMRPGTQWIYEGSTIEDDGNVVPHRIEVTAIDLSKMIAGVCTLVSYDVDYTDSELVEAELSFYAQDRGGRVWLLGEYPEEYEDGKIVKAPAWIHGFHSARAGIMMQADPSPGTPSYSEGWAPAVSWSDRGTIYEVGQKTIVPAGAFENVLVVKESAQSEPDAEQLKYYAPGVGNIRVGWTGTKKVKEVLELVKVVQLNQTPMAEIRAKAMRLEKSAYSRNNVYSQTAPAHIGNTCDTAGLKR